MDVVLLLTLIKEPFSNHKINECGVVTNPDVYKIPLPKGFAAEVRIAEYETGRVEYATSACDWKGQQGGYGYAISVFRRHPRFENTRAAMKDAVEEIIRFFGEKTPAYVKQAEVIRAWAGSVPIK